VRPTENHPRRTSWESTLINPEIVATAGDKRAMWEGCLSASPLDALMGKVPRWPRIRVCYFDQNGREHRRWFGGLVAQTIQHEIDHLDGIVCLDKADPHSLMTSGEYDKRLRLRHQPADLKENLTK
jgi:peptide deformylase